MNVPPGDLGVSKNVPGSTNTPFDVWCAKIAPKLKKIRKTLRQQYLFDFFFSILVIF